MRTSANSTKIARHGTLIAFLLLFCCLLSHNLISQDPSELDPTFSTDGFVDIQFPLGVSEGWKLTSDALDRIYVGGRYENHSGPIPIARLFPSGLLDNSFDSDGKLYVSFDNDPDTYAVLSELLIDGNEKLIVIGSVQEDNVTGHFALQRYTTAGTIDNTFGVNGTTQTYFGGISAFCYGAAIQSDGKILAVGKIIDGAEVKQVTVRYLSNGTVDTNFGSSGYVITDFLADAEATCVKVHDNKIYFGGFKLGTINAPGTRMTVVRLNMDGTLDGTFSNNGIWIGPTANSGGGYARDIIVQPDGNILLMGVESIQFGGLGTRLYRLTNNGGWDNSFVGGGVVDYTGDIVTPRAAQLASDGKILLAGYFSNGLCVSRLLANGAIDQGWGTNGNACHLSGADGIAMDIAIQSNGSILLAGTGSGGFLLCRLFGGNVGIAGISGPTLGVSVYPNPIVESATITYTLAASEELTIALHDLQGRVLVTNLNGKDMPAGEHTQTITMPSDLASGNYLLVFSSPKGRMSVQVTKAN